MKNLGAIIIVLIFVMGCATQPKHVADKIIEDTKTKFGNFIDLDTMNDGTLFYSFSYVGSDLMAKEKEIKGNIDKQLNILPSSSNEIQIGPGYTYNRYEWETPEIKMQLQSNFSYEQNKDSLYLRYWIDKK